MTSQVYWIENICSLLSRTKALTNSKATYGTLHPSIKGLRRHEVLWINRKYSADVFYLNAIQHLLKIFLKNNVVVKKKRFFSWGWEGHVHFHSLLRLQHHVYNLSGQLVWFDDLQLKTLIILVLNLVAYVSSLQLTTFISISKHHGFKILKVSLIETLDIWSRISSF